MSSPRRWLVTGCAGFIGSHLVERLVADGDVVRGLDNLSTGSMTHLEDVTPQDAFEFIEGDVRDPAAVRRALDSIDIVVHLAAAVGVRLVLERPLQMIQTNVEGTDNVLAAAADAGAGRVVLASTSEVYGKDRGGVLREDDDVLLGPTSRARWGYAATKMIDEFLAFGYERERGLETSVVRLFNTIGPRQTGQYGMVVPTLCRQALAGEPLTVFGDGSQRRVFCDVRETVRALVEIAGLPAAAGRVVNVAGREEVTIARLAALVLELTGSASPIELTPYEQAYGEGFEDMQRRQPSTDRLHELLGWTPERPLAATLGDVIGWLRREAGQAALFRP